jgi:hypothetical protein
MFIDAGHSSTYKHLGAMRGEPAHLKGITQDKFKGSNTHEPTIAGRSVTRVSKSPVGRSPSVPVCVAHLSGESA